MRVHKGQDRPSRMGQTGNAGLERILYTTYKREQIRLTGLDIQNGSNMTEYIQDRTSFPG